MCVPLVIKIVPRLCQGFSYFGNDSGRIQEVFNRATKCRLGSYSTAIAIARV